MSLKVGRKYKVSGACPFTTYTVEVAGPVYKLPSDNLNRDRVLVKDLGGDFYESATDLEDCVGGNMTFLYNTNELTFVEITLEDQLEGLIKELFSNILSVEEVLEIWRLQNLIDFFSDEVAGWMLSGFLFGKGFSAEEINAVLPTPESIITVIKTFNFD